jgi:ubiquinone/menaquinone biosynthesis C-methylase UbiE
MKVVIAQNRIDEYELRARYLKDDYHLAGRGKKETEFTIEQVIRFLPLDVQDTVLDIGPGNGLLFELIHHRVAECWGVDPSEAMVDRLRRKFSPVPNVSFKVAKASQLPFLDGTFDTVVISGVISYMENEDEVRKSLAEVKRVAKIGARVYIGNVPFVDESTLPPERKTVGDWFRRKLQEGGVTELAASARIHVSRIIRRTLNLEPVLIPSMHDLYFSQENFLAMCRENRLEGTVMRSETIHGISPSRNDYVLNRIPDPS